MKAILRMAVFSIFIMTLAATAKAQTDAKTNASVLTSGKITGAWRVNYAESDNPIEKMRAMLQNESLTANQQKIEKSVAETNALPAMSVSILPPETLVLADDGDEKSITINENFNEIVYTRTVSTDGVKRFGEIQNGAVFAVAAARENDALKIETESPRGNRMIETYALAPDGKKLIVTLRFENEQAREIFTLRRVYDRTLPDVFLNTTEEMQ